jgi:hypothetical protein
VVVAYASRRVAVRDLPPHHTRNPSQECRYYRSTVTAISE